MDDLEQQLRSTLRDPRRDVDYAADPLPAVRAGMRRRLRRRSAAMAATAVLLVVAAGTAIGTLNRGGDLDEPPVSPSLTTSAVPTPSVSAASSAPAVVSSPPPAAGSSVNPSASAPSSSFLAASAPALAGVTGFAAEDVSFVSATKGWAIGSGQCAGKVCTAILGTNDGGATWQRLGAPTAPITPVGAMCSDVCVRQLRFANSDVGYLFGGTAYMTSNGGTTWAKTGNEKVYALEPAGGDVIRVIATTDGCPPGCTFAVERSDVGAAKWTRLSTPALGGVGARLLRHGDDVYVFADQHTSGGAGDAHTQIIVSHDRGATWNARPDPCSPPSQNDPNESDSVDASTGVDGTLVLLCHRRDGATNGDTLRISTDGGATFGQPVPLLGQVGHVAAASAQTIVVAATSGSTVRLLRAVDGHSFNEVLLTDVGGQRESRFLAFTTAKAATWIDGAGRLWRTADGGVTWFPHAFG